MQIIGTSLVSMTVMFARKLKLFQLGVCITTIRLHFAYEAYYVPIMTYCISACA